ncbi:MAG: 30S ribosomal protein S6--L-glutamate ligase, partial [Planctomycetes bacterium]|nr:30S ribosomal protein S6--L-glutamate ligase [Planctomycetota bacterium]
VDIALRAAALLRLHVAGVDLLRDATGPRVLELNASPGLSGIEAATGRDVAGAIVEALAARLAQA